MRGIIAIIVGGAALAACTSTHDGTNCGAANRSITLGNMIANSSSGAYGACLTDMRAELAALSLKRGTLERNAASLRQQQVGLSGERAAAAGRLAAVNAEQAALLARLRNADVQQDELAALVPEQQALTARVEAANAGGGLRATEAEVFRHQQERARQRIEALAF